MDLETGLNMLMLKASNRQMEQLERFIAEIHLWNPLYGLVASGDNLVNRHVLDSLSGVTLIRELHPRRLADIGSGAGFPGIPLAILMDDVEITLIERSGRRAGFLRNAVITLGLRNITILEMSVEESSRGSFVEKYDVITFRAWSALDSKQMDSLAPILVPDGTVVAYKGRRDVIERELAFVSSRIHSVAIRPVTIPESGEERHLVLLKMQN